MTPTFRHAALSGLLSVLLAGSLCLAQMSGNWDDGQIDWEDYRLGLLNDKDSVEKKPAEYGKEFRGFALKLSLDEVDFEQDMAIPVTVMLKNDTERASLLPEAELGDAARGYALHLFLVTRDGQTQLCSRNLLSEPDHPVVQGKVPPQAETVLVQVAFDGIEVAGMSGFLDGRPNVGERPRWRPAGGLTPQPFAVKAVLLSSEEGKRPDFVLASQVSEIILRPKSVERMSPAEREEKLGRYVNRLREGAYGGMAVATQLAALKHHAVEPLIETAKLGTAKEDPVRESRIWSIAILCNTGSEKAEEFIRDTLQNPVALDDLSFLAWHSQRLGSKEITATIRSLVTDIALDRPLPWEKRHGTVGTGAKIGFLGWAFRHMSRVGETIPDDVAAGCFRLEDPRISSLAMDVWQPSSPAALIRAVKPYFLSRGTHPNLKLATLRCLHKEMGKQGFPHHERTGDLSASWSAAAVWLQRNGDFTHEELAAVLRNQIVFAQTPETRRALIALFAEHIGGDFPVRSSHIALPDDWIKTWQWCLKTGDYSSEEATHFLCSQMMTRDELAPQVKRALLVALKQQIGERFPLSSTENIDLEHDWPACGNWLIENGFFGKRKKR